MTLALYRPKSKKTSAFPKSRPLRNRAIGNKMASVLKSLWIHEHARRVATAAGVMLCLAFSRSVSADTFQVLKSFSGADGWAPLGNLVLVSNTLYGAASSGGADNSGVVYRLGTNGASYQVLHSFSVSDGSIPLAGMTLVNGTLFGTTSEAFSSYGTIFQINPDGSGFLNLLYFNWRATFMSGQPEAPLVAVNGILYGTGYSCSSPNGQTYGYGGVFQIATNYNSAPSDLVVFSDYRFPTAGLVCSAGKLYGTTTGGGGVTAGYPLGAGLIFSLNTNGTGYSVLKNFAGTDGATPRAELTLIGDTLYGTAEQGGAYGKGVIFSVKTNGAAYTVLRHFSGPDGAFPCAGLTASGNTLFGTASQGGTANAGVVFQVNLDGSGYALLKHFAGTDGASPMGTLLLSGNTLYGTAWTNGAGGGGAVYRLDLGPTPPIITVAPRSYTALEGDNVTLGVQVANALLPAFQWVLNATNLIAGATNATLAFTNVQLAQAGSYSVILTNTYGSITSPPAALEVLPPGLSTVSVCAQAALRSALAGGGPVVFACDGTFVVTNTLIIASNLSLDGAGHQVTLSGGNTLPVFQVTSNATLSLANLTIANGFTMGSGGGILNAGGALNATNCSFLGNQALATNAPGYPGADGSSGCGGAIYNAGALALSGCRFSQNAAAGGAGGGGAPARVGGGGNGGAIFNGGTMLADGLLFLTNSVTGGKGGPGANGTWFDAGGNGGSGGAGAGAAVFNSGTVWIGRSVFVGNLALGGQGGDGGAGSSLGDENFAGGNGGPGGAAAACFNAGTAAFVNCLFARNTSTGGSGGNGGPGGSGMENGVWYYAPNGVTGGIGQDAALVTTNSTACLTNCTLVWNSGLNCGGLNGPALLVNTLLAFNTPANVAGGPVDGGHNLSSDASGPFDAPGSLMNVNPLLSPLTDTGGGNYTVTLLPGSPAIGAASSFAAPITDQRGVFRLTGPADIGASAFGFPPVLRCSVSAGGGADLSIWGQAGMPFSLLASADPAHWTPVVTNQMGTGGLFRLHDAGASRQATRFFRVQAGYPVALRSVRSGQGAVDLWLSGGPGQAWRLLASSDLASWVPVATNSFAADGTFRFHDHSPASLSSRFYRLVSP